MGIKVSDKPPPLPSSTRSWRCRRSSDDNRRAEGREDADTALPDAQGVLGAWRREWLPKIVSALRATSRGRTPTRARALPMDAARRQGRGWQEFDARMAGMGLTVGQRTALKHLARIT